MFIFRVDDDISLRLLEANHAAPLFDVVDSNRAYLRQWMPWLDGTCDVAALAAFCERTRQQFAAGNGFTAGIWWRDEICGVLGHNRVDWENRATHVGYWLSAAFQGRGIMTRSCCALVGHAFAEMGLNRVAIRCATGNLKSRAVPERLNFRQEGVIRNAEWLYDRFVEHAIYGMLAAEWHDAQNI